MNTQFELQLIYSDLSRPVALNTIVSNLEKIDFVTDEIYSRINKSLAEKKNRLENIKSRLFRISAIFQTFEKLAKAITIKSAKYYPSKTEDNSRISYKTLYYEDTNDFNQIKHLKTIKEDLNTKPLNQNNLGRNPEGHIDDLNLNEELLKCLTLYSELTKDMDLIKVNEKQSKNLIEQNSKMFTDCFDYFTKSQVYGASSHEELSRLTTMTQNRESQQQQVVVPKNKKARGVMEEAPASLLEKSDPSKYAEEKHIIRRPTTTIDFNIPVSLNLGGIADIDMQTNQGADDYFTSKTPNKPPSETSSTNSGTTQGSNYYNNDENQEFQTPLDMFKNYNISKKLQKGNSSNNINFTPTPTPQTNSTPQQNTPQQNNPNQYTQPNTSNQSYTSSQPIPQQSQTVVSTPPSVPSIPSVPKIPTVPSVPSVPLVPSVPTVPSAPSMPLPPKIPVSNVPPEEKKQPEPSSDSSRGALLDEIRTENPMARLKKVPAGNVPEQKPAVAAKKEPAKPAAANPHDLLRQAIAMRYNKLNKNKQDSDEDD